MGFWKLWKLQLTGILTPTVDRVVVALKATLKRNVNSHFSQHFGDSENYGRQQSVFQVSGSSESSESSTTVDR